MAKRKKTAVEQPQQTILEAKSREEIYRKSEEFIAQLPEGTSWMRSCVEHRDGCFYQAITTIQGE